MNTLSLDIASLKAAYAEGRLTPTALAEEIIRRSADDPNRVWINRLPDEAIRAPADRRALRSRASKNSRDPGLGRVRRSSSPVSRWLPSNATSTPWPFGPWATLSTISVSAVVPRTS